MVFKVFSKEFHSFIKGGENRYPEKNQLTLYIVSKPRDYHGNNGSDYALLFEDLTLYHITFSNDISG